MLQQQACNLPVGDSIPVYTILHTMLQAEPELEVQIYHIKAVLIGKSGSKVVCFDHIESQCGTHVLDLNLWARWKVQDYWFSSSLFKKVHSLPYSFFVTHLWNQESTHNLLSQRHGHIPHDQAFWGQNGLQFSEEHVKVVSIFGCPFTAVPVHCSKTKTC